MGSLVTGIIAMSTTFHHYYLSNICIKTLIHHSTTQRHYKNPQYNIEEKDKTSYWASIHKRWEVPWMVPSKPCKRGDVANGCPDKWVE
jgi:hypothetical protein